jgi:hypothetical protein
MAPRFTGFWRYSLDFIDNLYRFGYPMLGQTQNEKISDFWKVLDLSLDNLGGFPFCLGTRPSG